ncbi:unnamed protein product [Clonostachys rhizophaga]|uniref:Uncharacterized protein n=1 Tax=Clonostachys rhizophaga TaxID=160324 RepID=A0A9N9VMM9_9HYPO|nr:unnamed protein product [Clonostachys rhizophaga]
MIHKVVRFWGSQESVSQKLGDFLCALRTPTRIMPFSTVRSMSFVIYPDRQEQPWETTFSDPLPVATYLPIQIFDSIRAMCNLRSMRLQVDWFGERQESFFYGLLQNVEIPAEYIRISASDRVMRRVLEKSPQLQALHLPETTDITQFEPVIGRLRRLCAAVGRVQSGGPIQFPAINEVNLKKIAERYQSLEELVLSICPSSHEYETLDREAVASAFEKDFAKAIRIFKRMPGLKRLAICIELEAAHSFGFTYAEEDRFYTDRLLRLSTCLPRLVQISITNGVDQYWTVTRASPGEMTIGRGIWGYKEAGFPHSVNEGF